MHKKGGSVELIKQIVEICNKRTDSNLPPISKKVSVLIIKTALTVLIIIIQNPHIKVYFYVF